MEKEIRQMNPGSLEVPRNIIDLLEEIRLTSLNLAVASAKFKAYNIRQAHIKKDLTEVVALALESVQFITKFLEEMGMKLPQSSWLSDEIDHEKINDNLIKLREYLESITNNFMKDKGLL
ncbi:MAG TPA: hypothetical protein ENO22_00775 [candidate division Zixibacteria bacterium]|nr:hypothetical protein [candidate division Zixibacteria bacterium]